MTTTVFIADGHKLIADCMAYTLDREHDLTVIGRTTRYEELFHRCTSLHPDVIITGVDAPEFDGINAIRTVKATPAPAPRVLVVAADTRPGIIRRALQAGADGYVLRTRSAGAVAEAIRGVHRGRTILDPEVQHLCESCGDSPLTPRETQVLQAARQGQTVATIAERVLLSCGTVRNVLSAAIRKTGAVNRNEAVHIADQNGWL